MANNSPTIVVASLSDDQLKKSIDALVTHVDEAMKKMVQSTNNAVGEMEAKLKSLGNLKIDSGGSADGGASKRTKAQNAETDAIDKAITARGKQIKQNQEAAMSFDQIAAALSKARQMVSEFNTKRASGILPSSEDYKRYEQALARIVEYNDKLKQSALSRADANQWANVFDARRNVKDLFSTDERLKQLNKYYTEQEKMTAKRQALVDKEVAAYNDAMRKKEQSLASYTEKERASIEKYQDKVLKTAWRDALRMPTENIDQATAKIERIKSLISTLHPIGIISKADVDVADATILKLEKRFDIQSAVNKETKEGIKFENQSRDAINALNTAISQNTSRETERQRAMIESGVAAQNAFAKIRQSVQDQLAVNTEKPIQGIQELTEAIKNMNRLYWGISVDGKESPLGQALKRDIDNAIELRKNIEAFNRNLSGIQFRGTKDGDGVGSTIGSYTELSNILKSLTDEYRKLGREERNAAKGDELANKIQNLSRATQKMQQQMSRPISLSAAMKGDEKTLDDIAYKMQRLRSYRHGIDLTKPNAANEIKQVDEALQRLQRDADKWMSKSKDMIASNNALGRSWNYMKNRLAFYFTVGAGTQFIKNLIDVRSQYEMNERALGILIDSAERGTQIFNELSQMALVSPYTLIELSSAAKQLTAYDVAARDVVDTTRRLADMAAAVGIPIERLTYALGQIKAYGYLNSRDARMFANAGIPLVKQLSEYYTELEGRLVSTADVYDRIKKKSIDYNEVMEVMYKMTDQGGKFFDFQAKMADTLKVRLANLTLAWNNMLNEMGKESQGVLTLGIGALRDLFLQWRKLDKLIKDAAWVVGIRTAFMLFAVACFKAGNALGATTMQMSLSSAVGTRLAGVITTLWKSFSTLVSSRLTWFSLLAIAAVEATQALFGVNEAQKALNESIRNGAKENYNNISKFIEQYREIRDSLYKKEEKPIFVNSTNLLTGKQVRSQISTQTVTTTNDIDENEAKKAWEAIREQIELAVASSDKYIGNLLSISNISERIRQGFNLLEDVQVVNAALKELDDDTIKVAKDYSALWNAYQAPEGLIKNLKDLVDAENELVETYGSVEAAKKGGGQLYRDYEKRELANFRNDLQETTDSIINFIELKGWSGNESKINQVFEQITQKLILDNQLDPQKAFTLQTEVEEARSNAARQALLQRINDEKEAYKISRDEQLRQSINADVARYNHWEETNGRSKVEWERFTKWLKEQHISETTAMFRNMDAEDIKSLNFQEGKHAEWVTRMVTRYAKEHKMSYDEAFNYLKSWVRSANQWSVFIPLYISSEDKKSVYDQLGEYDKAVDAADAEIERLTTRIDELRKKKELDKNETDELTRAEKELSDAQKAKTDAEAKGGHGKKEKKDERASQKAAKQAESELAKALKDELSTIEKVRSIYKDLTKEGMSHADAVAKATKGWNETVNAINKVLSKNGMKLLNLADFVGVENPREMMNTLQSQLESMVKRGASSSEIKVIQEKIRTLEVDADKYDLTKITKGLNNELDRLKEEYELAVALDADPELGGMFASYMGVDLDELPRNAEEAAKKAQEYIDKILAENNSSEKIDISSLMDKKAFDSWVESSRHNLEDELVKAVGAFRSYLHKVNVDETKNQAQEWNKLLEKYAEYEYKVTQIQKEAEREREVARKKGASQDVFDAINNRERQEIARVGFEKFQKSPEWIAATGDLANMSKSAIEMLIEELERYRKTAKNLSPKEIKQLNNALSKLYKEQRKNNPFKAVANMFDEAKERMSIFDDEIEEAQKQIDELSKKHKANLIDGIADDDTQKKLKETKERLSKLKEERNNIGKIDASTWVSSINETISAVKSAIEVFDGLAKAIDGVENSDVDKVFSILDSAGKGASTGAAFGPYGAIIGGVVGAAAGVVNAFADVWSGNERINKSIEVSTQKVRALEREYKRLERAVDDAYGTDSVGAQRLMMLNKEAELAELERQLELEKSRKAKNRDQEKINELRDKVEELRYEVDNAAREIILDLLEIGDAQDWANDFVKGMIDAFREGENYMKSYEDAFREMVDNLIAKTIAGKVIGARIEQMLANIKEIAKTRAESDPDVVAAKKALEKEELGRDTLYAFREGGEYVPESAFDIANERIKKAQQIYDEIYTKAVQPTPEDVKGIRDSISSWKDDVKNEFDTYMEAFGVEFGSAKDSQQLSALQQGISQISEQTANSIEAYLNGVSQQVYLHSELLTQIRDVIMGTNSDIQLGVQGQMLLQLQNNYIVMQSMQSMMEGWTTPSGQGIRVELIS